MKTINKEQTKSVKLNKADLHGSLADPLLDSLNFLNEVIDRFPKAISFAPGAPFEGFFDDFDTSRYIDLYVDHLRQDKGLSASGIRRHLYQYGPSRGQINGLIATALRIDEDIHVEPREVVVTVGAQEAMLLVLRALCASNVDLIAIVNPSFVGIAGAARVLDIGIVPINETDRGIDVVELRSACERAQSEGKKIKALYVAPDFSNPSGTNIDLETRHRLLSLADQYDFLILEDNAYGFTAPLGTALPTLKSMDSNNRVIYLGTCAKMCLPGVRVGFVVAGQSIDDECGGKRLLSDELSALKSMVTVNTSPICQAIVGGMLLAHGGSLAEVGREKARLYQENLRLLLDALDRHISPECLDHGISWNKPKGGFFVRMRLPVIVDNALLEISAGKYNVLWTPMKNFYLTNQGSNELRLSCSYLTPDAIDEGIRRLSLFLRDLFAPASSHVDYSTAIS